MTENLNKVNTFTFELLRTASALLNIELLNLLKRWLHIFSGLDWS